MKTSAGIKLTPKQIKQIKAFENLMKHWDKNLCINSISGKLQILLLGNTKQNPMPEESNTGGFNPDNKIIEFPNINSDGGGW
jgi:hypothetical protein